MRKLLLICSCILILGACSRNKADVPTKAQSVPGFQSAYLYTAALHHYAAEDFVGADYLFRMAEKFDPDSVTLKKKILETNIQLARYQVISLNQVEALIDTLRFSTVFDEDMLNNAFWVYTNTQNKAKLSETISELIKRFPSAKYHLVQYFHDLRYNGINSVSTLDKAFSLAGTDVGILIYIAELYTELAPQKAISTIQRVREIQRSLESDEIFLRLLFGLGAIDQARKVFNSYKYPDDIEYLRQYIDFAMSISEYDEILIHKSRILEINDVTLLQRLAAIAFIEMDVQTLNAIEKAIPQWTGDPKEDSQIYVVLITQQLSSGDIVHGGDYYDKLFSVYDIDSIIRLRLLRWESETKDPNPVIDRAFLSDFEARIELIPNEIIRKYFESYSQLLGGKAEEELFFRAKAELSRDLLDRGFGTKAEYEFLFQFYYTTGDDDLRIDTLKEAISKYPDEAVFLNDLGYTYLIQGKDFDEAKRLITSALYIEPESPHFLDSIAWYYYLTGDPHRALEHMKIPMQMAEMPSEISYHLGMIFIALNDLDKAQHYLQLASKGDDDFAQKAMESLINMKIKLPVSGNKR